MPSLTAKREKLVGPLHLVLIGVLFAVSFYYLLPENDAFIISDTDEKDYSLPIGELDLAYLKARSATGRSTSSDTTRAVVALIKAGQIDTARELLGDEPDINLGEQERFALDLEIASVEYFAAENDRQRATTKLALLNRIELLLQKPQLRSRAHLERAAQVSELLDVPDTTGSLYSLLAAAAPDNASHWFGKCARIHLAHKQYSQSSDCFTRAIDSAKTSDEVFSLRLEQLYPVSNGGSPIELDSIIHSLSTHQPLSNVQREKLAASMLANQRPEKAYPQYEILADNDSGNKLKWLLEAAKWAQASNEPGQAATYLDQAASISSNVRKVDLLQRAESLLVAAGKSDEVFDRLEARINKRPNDDALLRQGIELARQLGKVEHAVKWNRQLVQINPTDTNAINTQIDLALADSDLNSAAKWSRHAVGLTPNDKAQRVRLAQILEWNGDPVAAQREWEWIAERYPEVGHIDQVVRLAELNRETDVAVEYLHKLVMLKPTDDKKIRQLVSLYELEGTPLTAATLLIDLQAKNGMRAFSQRELARLYQRHLLFPESLAAWEIFASRFGRSTEETLNRMELLWRSKQPSVAAEVASHLVGTSNVSEASSFQIRLLSEIAWRFRMPELASLVKPHLATIEDKEESILLGKRLVQSLEDAGKDEEAIKQATLLWQNTQSTDMAFTAMNLAYKTGSVESAAPFLIQTEETAELRKTPNYWNMAAYIHQKNGQPDAALAAYEQALSLDEYNSQALSGLLWAHIDTQNLDAIADFLLTYRVVAESDPALWSPFGIAYLQLGLAEQSLTWFDRQLDRIEADYNMLLTFADALEYAGRAEPARKVRLYTIRKLRPALADGSAEDQDALVRQYAQLLNRYGSAEDREGVTELMLTSASNQTEPKEFWREDIAISWLMATQRHEHARLVMAKIHHQRLNAPAWQELALAMAANDVGQIHEVLNGSGKVSVGNHILALRQIGDDQSAFTMAKSALHSAPSLSDREMARSQYQAMLNERPRFTGGNHRQTSMRGLGITETGFSVRHTLASMNLGFAVDYTERAFSSNTYTMAGNDVQSDIALTLFHGDRRFGGKVTAGYNSNESDSLAYALTQHHFRNRSGTSTVTAELAHNEALSSSALLRLAARQNRATVGYEQALGFREYVKLQAGIKDISTRVQEKRIARGLQARVEFGIRGAFGSNVWSTSVAANREQNDVASELPEELDLAPGTSMNSILTDKNTSLSFGASLSRGGIQGDYPQASSPRYFLNANVAHSWPDSTIGLQLDGGAGIRVLGGDELSIGFALDTQPAGDLVRDYDSTTVGVNYRYHF